LSTTESGGSELESLLVGEPVFVTDDASESRVGSIPTWCIDDGPWELAPDRSITTMGDLVLSSTGGFSIGLDAPFDVLVRTGPGEWSPAAGAPLRDVQHATVVATDHQLLVWSLDLNR
jgi:hypothetical protein